MRIVGKGVWGPPADRDECVRVLRRAAELGVNFIDTADSYGPYISEDIIREALAVYLASAVSPGDKVTSRTRRSRAAVPATAARAGTPAKAAPAAAAKRVSASAKTARTRSGVVAKRPAK